MPITRLLHLHYRLSLFLIMIRLLLPLDMNPLLLPLLWRGCQIVLESIWSLCPAASNPDLQRTPFQLLICLWNASHKSMSMTIPMRMPMEYDVVEVNEFAADVIHFLST